MTDAREIDRSDWYVQVTAPGVPYSAIRVAFTKEAVAEAVLMCKYLAQEWHRAFNGAPPDGQTTFHDEEPQGVQVVINPETHEAEMPRSGERVTGELFACPDCGQQAKPSVERYQQWEPGPDGRMYQQKWFCANERCSTKSLWRSKLRELAPTR